MESVLMESVYLSVCACVCARIKCELISFDE